MRLMQSMFRVAGPLIVAMSLAVAGCDRGESEAPATKTDAGTASSPVAAPTVPATQPIIPVAQIADWCPEHGVPESVCTRCNESLVAGFKAKGDWDEQHNLPKSQCFVCDPTLKQKFAAAYKEKYGKDAPAAGGEEKHNH